MRRQLAVTVLAVLLIASIFAPVPVAAEQVQGTRSAGEHRTTFLSQLTDTFLGWIQAIWDEEKGQIVP
jgi:hypothetical protein